MDLGLTNGMMGEKLWIAKMTTEEKRKLRCYACLNNIEVALDWYYCKDTNTTYCQRHKDNGWSAYCNTTEEHIHNKISQIKIGE